MRERVECLHDSFVDFAGEVHHFTMVALSASYDFDYWLSDEYYPKKGLYLGIAICNPEDEFNEEIGYKKALGRAKNNEPALVAAKPGYINTPMVQAFLRQEAEYLKNNPSQYITGYAEKERKWKEDKDMQELRNSFTEEEEHIVSSTIANKSFLDKVLDYLLWHWEKTRKQR